MSSTCSAAGCRNDRRYRERLIIMPHVTELQFHAPRPDEYLKWQLRIDRKNYTVNASTRICSNHFTFGKPLAARRIPTMYLRSYPDWAQSKPNAIKTATSLSDNIICELLAHMVQYVHPSVVQQITEKFFKDDLPSPNCTVETLCHHLVNLQKDEARKMLPQIAGYVAPGKVVEAVAVFHHGVVFDGMKTFTPVPDMQTEQMEVEVEEECCTPYSLTSFHTYSIGKPNNQDTVMDVQEHNSSCNTSSKRATCCRKPACSRKMEALEEKIKLLNGQVNCLSAEKETLIEQNRDLQKDLTDSQKEVIGLQKDLNQAPVSMEKIKTSDSLVKLHTGLPTYQHFAWLLKEVTPAAEGMNYWKGQQTNDNADRGDKPKRGPSRSLSLDDELLLTLMKLKLNIVEEYMAHLFNISSSLVSKILSTWIPLLSRELSGLIYWPCRQEVNLCYPDCFKRWDGITAILDCFEVATEKPSHVDANSKIFSSYKNRPTVKFLLACTPGGSVSFISQPAGGNMSDKEIVNQCNILEKFAPGDKCMADKGFRIAGELLERGVELILPPFVKGGKPFTEQENQQNKAITHARIHVERVIGRVRDYAHLNGVVPLTQLDLIGPAAVVCCALTNLKQSVVPLTKIV